MALRKRKFPRVSEGWKIEYRVVEADKLEQSPISAFAVNISGGGICFAAEETVSPGSMITIEMSSPGFGSPVLALAKVVWCKPSRKSKGHEVGAEFWWVGWSDNDAQKSVADYIREKAEGQCDG